MELYRGSDVSITMLEVTQAIRSDSKDAIRELWTTVKDAWSV